MQTIATVTTAPERTALTTLDRVKLELNISGEASDTILTAKINEASSDIEAHISRTLASAGLTERFWGEPYCAEYLILNRHPVGTIASVTVDDVAVDAGEYRLNAETGQLYRLDANGYPFVWTWCKDIVVVYTAGYELPGSDNPTLPAAIEAAAVELVTSYWTAKGRDPTIRSEDIPGLGAVTYWVGAVGASGELPPSVVSKIAPFRNQHL